MVEQGKERLYYKLGDPVDEKKARHIMRYNFVADQLKDKNVATILDFGCGAGYGTKLLATAFPKATITGYDISEEAIEYAKQNNEATNVTFTTNPEVLQKQHDVITLIDCIEHLTLDKQNEILQTLTNNNKQTTYFISTPLSNFVGQSPTNPYHIACHTKQTFSEMLAKQFNYEYWIIDWYFYRQMNVEEPYGAIMAICEVLK